jgi:hypothetical protein
MKRATLVQLVMISGNDCKFETLLRILLAPFRSEKRGSSYVQYKLLFHPSRLSLQLIV